MPEAKQKNRRQVIEEARRAALDGEWDAAIEINKELIERDPKDTAAYNRLGRAYLEQRDYSAAYEAYSDALKSDPANLISRRNLQRLEHLRSGDAPTEAPATIFPRTLVFIEEVGKTWVDELVNPAPMIELAEIYAGQKLELVPEGNRLMVHDASGRRIGEVEAKTAERVMQLMAGGNIYEVYALGPSAASIRVILREIHRDPSLAGQISFPRQIAATRKYLRERDDLRRRDEADFYLDDEEAEE
ncbi:MAG: tetratricopeptide repeat protein, partial [Thermomicrobiales bacterium]|nr:tetratricopeptide repeat protein [Thermomicrobiales bacterium]